MTQRVLGPTGSRRRRRFLLAPVFILALTALYFAVGAQAVHDTGAFQLDGDAASATHAIPTNGADDWDKVCHQYGGVATPDTFCSTTQDTTGSTSGSWSSDGSLNATIFTGGGSKDPIDISSWNWKDGAGGLPDKDNLLHAFAARYSLDPTDAGQPPGSTNCPNGTGGTGQPTFDPTIKCDVIYFGMDRFDNSGDAQNGFWFLQNNINLVTGKTNTFSGVHKTGDVLVVSDFSIGGTTSTITIYKWDPACTATNKPDADCADSNLRQLETSTSANCASVSAADGFCGITNPNDTTTVPWSTDFTDKSGFHSYLKGELYEAGINLSTLGLAGECFSTMVAESRASTSTVATLKDFVIAHFPQCKPRMDTQASTNGTVLPGVPVHDTATIQIIGGASPPDPTGTVTFYLCKPATPTGDCGTSGGDLVGTGALNGGTNTTDGLATAQSPDVNTSASKLSPGRYCFRATWPGDTTYPLSTPLNVTNGTTECFTVHDTSSTATHQIWLPNDKATVTSTGGTNLNGTVKFVLYSGGTCSGTQLWPKATDPAGTGEFTLTDAASGTVVGPTSNTAVTVEADDTVSWKVTFTSTDAGVDGSTATCEVSALNLTPDQ